MDFMELFNASKEFVLEYYPVVVAGAIAIGTFMATAYMFWKQASAVIQPIIDKIQAFRDKDDETAETKSILESIQIDTMKADLIYKIENTSVNPELTAIYQEQLDKLNDLTNNDTVSNIEETINKYLG